MSFRRDPRVLGFVEAARQFQALIEDKNLKGKELVRSLLPSVAKLYTTALALEPIEPEAPVDFNNPMTSEQWQVLFHELWGRIGPDACYWLMFDPTEPDQFDDNPVAGNLGMDLADIYQDIIPPLKAWDDGEDAVAGGALEEWRFQFTANWGRHAVGALGTLHWLEMKAGWGGLLRVDDSPV